MNPLSTQEIIEQTKKYLHQQSELYGNEVWLTENSSGGEEIAAEIARHPEDDEYQGLDDFHEAIKDCLLCPLGKTRTKFVFGVGNPRSKLVLVGEAPGRDEDLQGEPFVGAAGQLLTKILKAIDLKREDIYICNILKCRPPNNRDPQEDEVEQCEPYLVKQLQLIKPKIIVALGRIAAQNLLKTKSSLKQLRGNVLNYEGIQLVVTYHPAALLRNPGFKRPTWEDFQMIQKLYLES